MPDSSFQRPHAIVASAELIIESPRVGTRFERLRQQSRIMRL